MKLQKLGNNEAVVSTGNVSVLFSYETPVAACINGTYYRTEVNYSVTTQKHINRWAGKGVETKPQSWFDSLLK